MNDTTKTKPLAPATGSACIVVWADDMGLCIPMGWDDDCEGAICGFQKDVALFSDRREARRAIDISTKFAALCKAQGKPANEDFLGECRRNVRVVPLRPNAAGEPPATKTQ